MSTTNRSMGWRRRTTRTWWRSWFRLSKAYLRAPGGNYMLRVSRILPFLALALAALALGHSIPARAEGAIGSVSGNVYTNELLGLTWEFPKDWTVADSAHSAENR